MNLRTAISRARRGLREDLKLYLVAVSSLTVAFLCLAGSFLALTNLSSMSERLGESRRMTLYLVDGARAEDVEHLRVLLDSLSEIAAVEHVTSAQARALFLEQSDATGELASLPAEAFPASFEVRFEETVSAGRSEEIAGRVSQLGVIAEIETYASWFQSLDSLVAAARGLAIGLAILVLICVLAVVGNTIRLAVAGRRDEIQVMKLCGATDEFVRSPFVVEGAFQGFAAAGCSVLLLLIAFVAIRGRLDASLAALTGVQTVFLEPWLVAAIVLGGGLVGAAGSALSLRRYLEV